MGQITENNRLHKLSGKAKNFLSLHDLFKLLKSSDAPHQRTIKLMSWILLSLISVGCGSSPPNDTDGSDADLDSGFCVEGEICDDGLYCTINDTCLEGQCQGHPRDCDDGVNCNGAERCSDSLNSCISGTPTCSENQACDIAHDRCVSTCDGCLIDSICYEPGDVNPYDDCRICNPVRDDSWWTVAQSGSCDDGYYCTVSDSCTDGRCRGTPRVCNDGIDCNGEEDCDDTLDSCTPGESTCGPNEMCDLETDTCVTTCPDCAIDGVCYSEGEVNSFNSCLFCDTAQSTTSWSNNDGADCNDGRFCNGTDTCSAGTCSNHAGTPCPNDGLYCNGVEGCDDDTESCIRSIPPCRDDGVFCNGEESCDEVLDVCGTPIAPCGDDGIFCNGEESCIEDSDSCLSSGSPCSAIGECLEDEEQCCEPERSLACNDEGSVIWLDSCGRPGDVVDECTGSHQECIDGACACEPGWYGDDCETCVIYVDVVNGRDFYWGTSWSDALNQVQTALDMAEPEGCEIWVARGTYQSANLIDPEATFQLRPGVDLYGGFDGTETHREERDPELNETILSGSDANSYHVVTGAEDTRLDGFWIMDGSATNLSSPPNRRGGGMYNDSVSPTVANCTFDENEAFDGGGAMANVGNASPILIGCTFYGDNTARFASNINMSHTSSITITDSTLYGNSKQISVYSNSSGSINISNSTFSSSLTGLEINGSSLSITDSTFRRNEKGLYIRSTTGASVENSTFHQNTNRGLEVHTDLLTLTNGTFTENDTGIYIVDSSPTIVDTDILDSTWNGIYVTSGSPQITNCSFENNNYGLRGTSTSIVEGSDFVENEEGIINEGSIIVRRCLFDSNTDGAMTVWNFSGYIEESTFQNNTVITSVPGLGIERSTGTVVNCIFNNNSGDRGGGLFLNESTTHITNCIFINNTSDNGGGMNLRSSSPTITNCTFTGNEADTNGGGIYNSLASSPVITNSIFWGNNAIPVVSDNEIHNADMESDPIVTYSIVEGGYRGVGNFDDDPLFVDAAGEDLHLQAESPCIDQGNSAVLPPDTTDLDGDDDTTEAVPLDFDFENRLVDGDGDTAPVVDLGAFEYQP